MNNLIKYDEFLIEGTLSTVSDFLKAQFNNIFSDPNQSLNNLFNTFTKKLNNEKNVNNLYQKFIKNNQTIVQNEINTAESIDVINKLITDNIKYFYFSLKPVVNKLQNDEFTMKTIFERSRDKRLQKLMLFPEDQFSNAVQEYVNDAVLPQIKKDAGLDLKDTEKQQTQEPQQTQNQPTQERIMYNITKILEADQQTNQEEDLVKYKKSAIKWINLSLFDLLKPIFTKMNSLGNNTGNSVDQLSRQMKSTDNDNAKKMILNKIINMDREELQNLANTLGIKEEELGKL